MKSRMVRSDWHEGKFAVLFCVLKFCCLCYSILCVLTSIHVGTPLRKDSTVSHAFEEHMMEDTVVPIVMDEISLHDDEPETIRYLLSQMTYSHPHLFTLFRSSSLITSSLLTYNRFSS